MKMSKSRQMAICGLLGALMLVIMLLGGLIPLATFLCPGLAGIILIPAQRECGASSAKALYVVVSILSLFLSPDKESAILFVLLLGHYPLIRPLLERLHPRPVRWLGKLVVFNLCLLVSYAILFFILAPALLTEEFSTYTLWGVLGLLALGNITFVLYDCLVGRFVPLYEFKLRPKIFSSSRFKH